jgi:hypothetical protein
MGTENIPSATKENPNLMEAYTLLCGSYHAIDDFRAKLLGYLPVVSGAGIFFLMEKIPWEKIGMLSPEAKSTFIAAGSFGFIITLGLFAYELYGIKKCSALIQAGRQMEHSLTITNGQFLTRPDNIAGVVNEPFASGVIYSAALAAWSFLALFFSYPKGNTAIPIGIFLIGFFGTLGYDYFLRHQATK